jgi:hypothetical protein
VTATLPDLPTLARNDAEVRAILDDSSVGGREAARRINRLRGTGTTSEKSVRRYRRNRELTADRLADPQPTSVSQPVKGSGGQWHTGIDFDPRQGGEFRTAPREVSREAPEPEPEEADLLREFDLDPAVWEVTSARKSLWQSGDRWLEARRVSFRKRGLGPLAPEDIEDIMSRYAREDRLRLAKDTQPGRIVMVAAGDLQLGKPDGGGTAATVDRFCRITDDIGSYLGELDAGAPQALILPWMGDCIEGTVSQRGRLLASLDIPVTTQVRMYRRLMMHQLAKYAGLADKVIIPVLPGNHDEATRDQVMPVHDSWAIEGASAVADWCDGRPGYDHVQFVFPEPGELGITIDVGTPEVPYVVSFHHGHSASSPAGVIPWWMKQSHGRAHYAQADMLVTAHFHHLRVEHTGGNRTWLQIPALDGGSEWYRERSGENGVSGMVSLEITPGAGQGWRGLTVHS